MREKNHEGYRDITACKAIRNIEKRRKRAYRERRMMYRLHEAKGFKEAARALLKNITM